jgi:hypothetical protein
MFNIKRSNLLELDFGRFHSVVPMSDTEFYGTPGKEHYKLLSHFSTLFDNCNIVDIGTHRGNSALALSYNTTNTVYTFDIIDKVINPDIKSVNNIRFVYDDLFQEEGRQKWKDILLSCPFIFLDVDPHNGDMEIDFFKYIKEIGYNGFVICDDIWYFKEMRDNFWYKIEDKYRYDLTDLGHWSGTGIITFNPDIKFPKFDVSNWTLVTAYFNLTKCHDASDEIKSRDQAYYISHSISTLSLPHNLVIYCDEDSIGLIRKIRPRYLDSKTKYIVCEFDDFRFKKNGAYLEQTFKDYREIVIQNRKEKPYNFDSRNTASYYLFCVSRYAMLKETIEANPFGSTHFCWINFCIERMGFRNLIRLDEGLAANRDKFSTCYIDYVPESLINNVPEYFQYGRCNMCSGFFTGNSKYMRKVCDLIEDKFLEYLSMGYGHADEQLYSPVYFQNPSMFELYCGDYQEMITNYRYIYDRPEPPIYNLITNSFNHGNYVVCYDACKYVLTSVILDKCALGADYTQTLMRYFMECKLKLNR